MKPVLLAFTATLLASTSTLAQDTVDVVASFSVLGDLVAEVGGEDVTVRTLVGPDGDAHVYEPTPDDVRAVAGADLLVVNGLGFEGWMDRLVQSAEYQGPIVVASTGVTPLAGEDEDEDEEDHDHEHADGEEHHHHEDEAEAGHHHHGGTDPHAWNDPTNTALYVANIAEGLAAVDPAHADAYRDRAEAYRTEIAAVDTANLALFAAIPEERRRVITSHDAFGYFGHHYGIDFLAPVGLSTESEPSAADVAAIIDQLRAENVTALFVENITDPRLVQQIAAETGAEIGGTLYSDALSPPDGPAATYLDMLGHNARLIAGALAHGS